MRLTNLDVRREAAAAVCAGPSSPPKPRVIGVRPSCFHGPPEKMPQSGAPRAKTLATPPRRGTTSPTARLSSGPPAPSCPQEIATIMLDLAYSHLPAQSTRYVVACQNRMGNDKSGLCPADRTRRMRLACSTTRSCEIAHEQAKQIAVSPCDRPASAEACHSAGSVIADATAAMASLLRANPALSYTALLFAGTASACHTLRPTRAAVRQFNAKHPLPTLAFQRAITRRQGNCLLDKDHRIATLVLAQVRS